MLSNQCLLTTTIEFITTENNIVIKYVANNLLLPNQNSHLGSLGS